MAPVRAANNDAWPAAIDTVSLARRIRRHAVRMTNAGKSSHVGSVLSMADIMAVLYGRILRVDPGQPSAPIATASC